ncbi:O-antigen polymerase [Arthrobacter sp. AFG20]|uniref:O-antigen polymerase n=1 Tax=Arthrobacter sp. AFG20 TaxID=1688671 RepID=UPI000C9E5B8C|nr:O-antigen polymerase [Arthrobacter sp. AFG20]PNH85229.1 hypothetical protein CXZ05_06855 [Arthrobacter sp. AFG20]
MINSLGTIRPQTTLLDLIAPVLIVLTGFLTPILISSSIDTWSTWVVIVLIVAMYAGCRLSLLAVNGRGRTVQLFFWIYIYFFAGLAPLAQIGEDTWPWPSDVSESAGSTAAMVLVVTLAGYEAGRFVQSRRPVPESVRAPRELSSRRMALVIPVAVALCLAQVLRIGPETLLSSRESIGTLIAATGGADARASAGLSSAALISASFVPAYLMITAKRNRIIKGWGLTSLVVICLALFASNPAASARYVTISVWVGLLLAMLWPLTRRTFFTLALGVVLGLLVLFPALNVFRREGARSTASDSLTGTLVQGDYDSFQQIANTVDYVTVHGHTWGHQVLSALLFWVPRSFWSDKGFDTGQIVAQDKGYDFTNLSAPLPAEMYIDGGFVLVATFFVFYGAVTVWAERQAQLPLRERGFMGLLVPVFSVYQVIMLRGSLLQSMGQIMVVALILWLCTKRSMRDEEPTEPAL